MATFRNKKKEIANFRGAFELVNSLEFFFNKIRVSVIKKGIQDDEENHIHSDRKVFEVNKEKKKYFCTGK